MGCFAVKATTLGEPVVVAKLAGARSIASDDGDGGCAVHEDGRLSCFGDLGLSFTHGHVGPFPKPTPIPLPGPVAEIAMMDGRACARTEAGRVLCFGCLALPAWTMRLMR